MLALMLDGDRGSGEVIEVLTGAVESACEALEGMLVGLDAEREREELVSDIHLV